jgi:hypothetical protein
MRPPNCSQCNEPLTLFAAGGLLWVVVLLLCGPEAAAEEALGTCVGNSSSLTPAECVAWQDLFDGIGLSKNKGGMAHTRHEPCGSTQGGGGGVVCKDGHITHIQVFPDEYPLHPHGGHLPLSIVHLTHLEQFVIFCHGLVGPVPPMNFSAISNCAIHDPAGSRDCFTEHGKIFADHPNNFSCPLPPGAAEHCHAKCDLKLDDESSPPPFEQLLEAAHAGAARNRANRLTGSAAFNPQLLPNFTNAPGSLWPTSITHGGPLSAAVMTLFANKNRTAMDLASAFLADALPTWYNNTFSAHPAGTARGACHPSADGSIPLDCFGSGCPLEHAILVRAFVLFGSASPYVATGTVGSLSAQTEAALQAFYFRYLVGNYAWYPGEPVRAGAECSGPQCANLTAATFCSGSGNGDHVRRSTAFLAAQTLSHSPAYRNKKLGDGQTVEQHYLRWEDFMYGWLEWTATNGLFRELGSAYWPRTWETVFNLHDLPISERVRKRAKFFLDIATVEAQQTSVGGVRGGEKSRAKRDGFGVWTSRSIGSAEGLQHTMLYQLAPMLFGDTGAFCDTSLPTCYHHCSDARQCRVSSASSTTLMSGEVSKPSGCNTISNCAFNRVVGAEAGFYQASNVSILMHLLGNYRSAAASYSVQNRLLGQISTEYRGPMGPSRCLQLYDRPDCTGPNALTLVDATFPCVSPPCDWPKVANASWVDPGTVLQKPSNQIHSQYYTAQFGIGGVEFSPNDLFEAVSQQRWTGLTFSNYLHTTLGMPHMTGEKWSVTRGNGGAAIQIAMKCASCMYGGPDPANNFTQHECGPVVDIFQASSILQSGEWLVVTAENSSGLVGYGAVRPVFGGAKLVNHTAMTGAAEPPHAFIGQYLMEEEWTPLIIVAGTEDEFKTLSNFTKALAVLDANTVVAPDNHSLAVEWASIHIEFYPNTKPNAYVLPKVDGSTIDVDPDFTYQGRHLNAAGRDPSVVSTRFEDARSGTAYETKYDFSVDTMETTAHDIVTVSAGPLKLDDTTATLSDDNRSPSSITHTDLMVPNGTGPWAGFRIPGFTSVRGHLLVFAEGRIAGQGCADFGHHDLVMRRSSETSGASWEPLRMILNPDEFFSDCNKTEAIPCTPAERANRNCQTGVGRQCDGGCAVWDPMPVVDHHTGAVHLVFGRSTSSCGEGQHPRSTGRRGPTDKADLWIMTSTDLGQSFGTPRNLTMNCSWPYGHGAIGTALHGWVPSGGHGIQLSETGELIAPIYNNAGQGLCISLDHGDSWHAGGWVHGDPAKYSGPYEGEVVELFRKTPSGGPRLLYDCRIGSGHCGAAVAGGPIVNNCRMMYTSDDLGGVFGPHNRKTAPPPPS